MEITMTQGYVVAAVFAVMMLISVSSLILAISLLIKLSLFKHKVLDKFSEQRIEYLQAHIDSTESISRITDLIKIFDSATVRNLKDLHNLIQWGDEPSNIKYGERFVAPTDEEVATAVDELERIEALDLENYKEDDE